jgi:DNA-binding MurR/RpiR family transcriptional regulator
MPCYRVQVVTSSRTIAPVITAPTSHIAQARATALARMMGLEPVTVAHVTQTCGARHRGYGPVPGRSQP